VDECKPLAAGAAAAGAAAAAPAAALAAAQPIPAAACHAGKAVRVEAMKLILKVPGTKRLKLKCRMLLSSIGFNFKLRRYAPAPPLQQMWLNFWAG